MHSMTRRYQPSKRREGQLGCTFHRLDQEIPSRCSIVSPLPPLPIVPLLHYSIAHCSITLLPIALLLYCSIAPLLHCSPSRYCHCSLSPAATALHRTVNALHPVTATAPIPPSRNGSSSRSICGPTVVQLQPPNAGSTLDPHGINSGSTVHIACRHLYILDGS